MSPQLPFRLVAVGLVLLGLWLALTALPDAPIQTTDRVLGLGVLAFLALAAKLLWQGERWVAWTLLVLQVPTLLLNGAVLIPRLGRTLSVDWPGIATSLLLIGLLALGLWWTRPDAHDDLATLDE